MQRQVFGGDHVELAKTWDALGNVAVAQRHFADAQTDYENAMAMCERAHFADEVCPRARNNLGMAYYRQDRFDAARLEMTKALAERRALFGNDHPTVAYSLSTLANLAVKQRDYKTAVDDSAQALAILDRAGRGASREDALIRFGYAQALWMINANTDALREIERTLADWQRLEPDAKARRVAMLVQKAQILNDLKRPDDARRTALDAIAVGATAAELAPRTKQLLRELSGKADAYPDAAAPAK
jgi:tetratricopeptide (TPR) repeat protein